MGVSLNGQSYLKILGGSLLLTLPFYLVSGVPIWPKWNHNTTTAIGSNFVFRAHGAEVPEYFVEADEYRLAQTQYINRVMQGQMYY
jgi:hypothetical protein